MTLTTRILRFYGTRLAHPGHWQLVNRLVETLKLDPGGDITIQAQGLAWKLNPADHVQKDLFWFGVKDRWDMGHLRGLIDAGSNPVILDVGANFGYYSLLLAAHCRRNARIFAIEPAQETANRLAANIAANDLGQTVCVKRAALGSHTGMANLTTVMGDTGLAHVSEEGGGSESVVMTTLDQFAEDERLEKLSFIKIDVEGFEPLVLQGGMKSLKKWRPLLFVELNPAALNRMGFSAEGLLAELRSLGYGCFVSHRRQLLPLETMPQPGEYVNVFGIHPDSVFAHNPSQTPYLDTAT